MISLNAWALVHLPACAMCVLLRVIYCCIVHKYIINRFFSSLLFSLSMCLVCCIFLGMLLRSIRFLRTYLIFVVVAFAMVLKYSRLLLFFDVAVLLS